MSDQKTEIAINTFFKIYGQLNKLLSKKEKSIYWDLLPQGVYAEGEGDSVLTYLEIKTRLGLTDAEIEDFGSAYLWLSNNINFITGSQHYKSWTVDDKLVICVTENSSVERTASEVAYLIGRSGVDLASFEGFQNEY